MQAVPLTINEPKSYLIDMDGVFIWGKTLIPNADIFIQRLHDRGSKFLLLTNNSRQTPRDLAFSLQDIGPNIQAENIFTSALADRKIFAYSKAKRNCVRDRRERTDIGLA